LNRSDPRNGIVLITVLWTIALLSALAMATSTTFRGLAGIVAVDRDKARADALLSAGLESSAYIVKKIADRPLTPRETVISLGTGSVHIRLSDDGGRINVNKAPEKVLAALLRSVGASDDANGIAKAIDTWRARDQKNRPGIAQPNNAVAAPVAATSAIPTITTPPETGSPNPAVPQNAGDSKADDGFQSFTDIRQLAQIPGMQPEYIAAIAPLTTVFGDEKVNVMTAPAEVLAALPEMPPGRISALLDARQNVPVSEDRLQQLMGPAAAYTRVGAPPIALVELTARLIDGYTARADAVIVVLSNDRQPYRVLAWTPLSASARGSTSGF
jgi:general secretion pathway protein K